MLRRRKINLKEFLGLNTDKTINVKTVEEGLDAGAKAMQGAIFVVTNGRTIIFLLLFMLIVTRIRCSFFRDNRKKRKPMRVVITRKNGKEVFNRLMALETFEITEIVSIYRSLGYDSTKNFFLTAVYYDNISDFKFYLKIFDRMEMRRGNLHVVKTGYIKIKPTYKDRTGKDEKLLSYCCILR